MAIFERLRIRIGQFLQRSEVIARLIPMFERNRPLPGPRDFVKFSKEGYRANILIHACIRAKATSVAEPDLVVDLVKPDDTVTQADERDPLVQLLNRPNREQSQYEWLEQLVTYLELAGENFVHKVRSRSGRARELWNLRPDRVNVVPGPDGLIDHYTYEIGQGDPFRIEPRDIIHLKLVDPLDDRRGLSPVMPVARWGDMDNEGADYFRAFFRNKGQIPGFLKLKGQVPKAERQRLKELWREEHVGLDSWHTVPVMDADADYIPLAAKPQELEIDAVFNQTETRLCMAWGIPPIIVATNIGLQRSTFANYAEARRVFWEDTLIPMFTRIADKLTHGLADEFPERGVRRAVRFDLTAVEALQEDRNADRELVIRAWDAGVLTRNEARRALDGVLDLSLDDLGGGDSVKEDPNFVLIPVSQSKSNGVPKRLPAPNRLTRFVDDEPDDVFWRALHRVADRLFPQVKRGFLDALEAVDAQLADVLPDIEAAIDARNVGAAVDLIPQLTEPLRARLQDAVEEAIRDSSALAGKALVESLHRDLLQEPEPLPPLPSDRITAAAETLLFRDLKGINQETLAAMKEMILRGLEKGEGPSVVARQIRARLGLTLRDETVVARFVDRLREQGVAGSEIARRTRLQIAARIRRRAETIARTEMIAAANAGALESYRDAAARGIVDAQKAGKEWMTALDDRVDIDICEPLDGQVVALNETFAGGFEHPPAHPRCRCSIAMSVEGLGLVSGGYTEALRRLAGVWAWPTHDRETVAVDV